MENEKLTSFGNSFQSKIIASLLVKKTFLQTISDILQEEYFDFVISLEPKRVLFNPGTENHRFNKLLDEKNIYWENSCSLVLLSTNQY